MLALLLACTPQPPPGPGARMDFAGEDFFAAPFPGDQRRRAHGAVDLAGWPDPEGRPVVVDTLALLDGVADGFSRTAGVIFPMEVALDVASLPTLEGSLAADASAWLVDVDPDSPERGRRIPVLADFRADPGPYGPDDALTLLPLQGMPLRSRTRYAAVLSTDLRTVDGEPLGVSDAVSRLRRDAGVLGLSPALAARYQDALVTLNALGEDLDRVAALTVFTTGAPEAALDALVADARGHAPAPPEALERTDDFDDYCVVQGVIELPVYQSGEPPYLDGGGGVVFDADGAPVLDRFESSRVVVTLPRGEAPADGWPLAVFIRTGGGGDRPLVDRGPHAEAHGEAEPGTGPALMMARAGWAGLSIDGPHGGLRNVTGGDEQFLIFNVSNPAAMRDNLRQSALELALVPELADALRLPGCDGDTVRLDTARLALVGHSMGATIAPLVMAASPRYRALVLSGAGGSWIENIVWKQSPLEVRPLAEAMLGYPQRGLELHAHDPFLGLLQWAGEAADPPVYAHRVIDGAEAPRHVFMAQGIIDTYILPPIANTTSLSLGLDLAGPALDANTPGLEPFRPLAELLPLVGRGEVALPAAANRPSGDDAVTAVVVQYAEDGIEDGHEVFFQRDDAREALRCFLASLSEDAPVVPGSTGCP